MLYVLPDFDLKQARSVVRIAARPATLQNLVIWLYQANDEGLTLEASAL